MRVLIIQDSADPNSWETCDTDLDIRDFLIEKFNGEWPATARIYHKEVNINNDVTPGDEAGIELLAKLEGPFAVVVYPGELFTVIIGIIAVLSLAATLLLMPTIPNAANRASDTPSPNNELAQRENKPRVGGRIPDIFGTVRSMPDLIAVPYKVFIGHEELEIAYMCVGRGSYAIDDIRDETTDLAEIDGASAEIYGPNTAPTNGDVPQLRLGSAITEKVWNVKRLNAVNGQVAVQPPDGSDPNTWVGTGANIGWNGEISGPYDHDNPAMSSKFAPGDRVTVSGASGAQNGTFIVGQVGEVAGWGGGITYVQLLLADGSGTQAWGAISTYTANVTITRTSSTSNIGPFVLDQPDMQQVYINFIALNGLYQEGRPKGSDVDSYQSALNVDIEVKLTPINSSGVVTGSTEVFTATLQGSSTVKTTRAMTMKIDPTFTGYALIEIRRTNTIPRNNWEGAIVDEVKVRDVYMMAPVTGHFGDVTTVLSATYATSGALAIKNRKLNMLATRKVAVLNSNGTTGALTASNKARDIFYAVCRDPYIGKRSAAEVDGVQIYSALAGVETYFGTALAAEFCYTFDKSNLSFQETAAIIAQAVFCEAYRRGNIIRLSFEKLNTNSTLLFNHRNKLPRTEKRSVRFGLPQDMDGLEYRYVDPYDDAIITLYMPTDKSAVKPKKLESAGVRNHVQAWFHYNRIWNKLKYQNLSVEFEATQEADLLIRQDRILMADNTRSDTVDGEVTAQSGLQLTLSQPIPVGMASLTIFLQHIDGTVQAIAVSSINATNRRIITLATAPTITLATNDELVRRAGYMITNASVVTPTAFLVNEKSPRSNFTSEIKAINYDSRYYTNDVDYINDDIPLPPTYVRPPPSSGVDTPPPPPDPPPSTSVLDTQSVTPGYYTDSYVTIFGYVASICGSISDGTSNVYSGAAVKRVIWYTSNILAIYINGNLANSGWTSITLEGVTYHRANVVGWAYDSGSGATYWYWNTTTTHMQELDVPVDLKFY